MPTIPHDPQNAAARSTLRREGDFLGTGMLLLLLMMQLTFSVFLQFMLFFGWVSPENTDGYWGLGNTGFLLFYAVVYAVAMGVPMLAASGGFRRPFRPFQRFHSGGESGISIGLSLLVGLGLCMFANLAAGQLMNVLSLFGVPTPDLPSYLEGTPMSLLLNVVVLAVLPALLEEMVFRGIVLRALLPYGRLFAAVVSSLLFALMHGNLLQVPFAFIVGFACAGLALRSGSIWPASLLHLMNNLVSVLLQYASLKWGTAMGNSLTLAVFFVVTVLALAAALLRQRIAVRNGWECGRPPSAVPLAPSEKAGALLSSPLFLMSVLAFIGLLILNTIGSGAA
ncbi:MAG: CPBP family intramembrane metalloprotease [Clostridiales bacterium]|jgi:membrane protease YdiL (CAAX protease family)|nr:CPBP family intramembrane metalloprotease [Clostridiales bacterium]